VWASVVKKMPATATAFLVLLVLAALLAPIEQARVHQLTSLDENMGFGLPFAALGAGYALGAWRQWLGWQRHWGKVIATTAAVITVVVMLIVGRVEHVQFRGPGTAVAGTIWDSITENYRSGTYVLVDGPDKAAQYYVHRVPGNKWLTSTPVASAEGFSMYTLLCSGSVSVVVLRSIAGSYASPYDQYIVRLMHGSYKRTQKVGTADHRTSVWKLSTPGQRLEGCPRAN
jgi:hypothetical protein